MVYNKQELKHLEEILENFNFEKVHDVMKTLNWRWHGYDSVPSLSQIIEFAKKLLQRCILESRSNNLPKYSISTGGFTALCKRSKKTGDVKYLTLYFSVADWTTD